MRILGVDIGETTGVCFIDLDKKELEFSEVNYRGNIDEYFYLRTAREVELEFKRHSPDIVFMEGYAYGGGYFNYLVPEITGQIKRFLFANNLPFCFIPPNTLKKIGVGKGNASKAEVKKAMKKYYLDKYSYKFMPRSSYHVFDAGLAASVGERYIKKELPPEQLNQLKEMMHEPKKY